jgi:type IV secretory pathway TrbF-like protein
MLGSYNLSLLFVGDNYELDTAHLHLDHCIATIGNPFHKREHNKVAVSVISMLRQRAHCLDK